MKMKLRFWRIAGVLLMLPLVSPSAHAATPATGSITETARVQTYTAGPFRVPNHTPILLLDSGPECGFLPASATTQPCDNYVLTVNLGARFIAANPSAYVKVTMSWTDGGTGKSDYDLYLYKGSPARSSLDGTVSPDYSAASQSNPEITQVSPFTAGPQQISFWIVPYTPTNDGIVSVTAELFDGPPQLPPPTPPALKPGQPRFQHFMAPPGVSEKSGEFNIGYNSANKHIMVMQAGPIWRLTPREAVDASMPESCEALWENRSALTTNLLALDPILWTDAKSGRTFASNSTAGANVEYAFSDDDGNTWTEGGIAPPSGTTDHQTIGSGPLPAVQGVPVPDNPVNRGQAVYYCAQSYPLGPATCQRSDTLGRTWGPAVVIYDGNTSNCSGLNGHVKVAPDGTVYVPASNCKAKQGGAFSADGGLTWKELLIPNSTPQSPGGSDPSIAVGAGNTIYYSYINGDGHARAVTGRRDPLTNTLSWTNDTDLGLAFGIKNASFPECTAGDDGRAACGFLGTPTSGNYENLAFPGVWHLYIATTYDGGVNWETVNATPGDPVQGAGGIWQEGGAATNRNLLDFNEVTHDEKGRILFGYDDGCVTGGCIADPTTNDFAAEMRVARQSGGKTLFASYDGLTDLPGSVLKVPKRACLGGQRTPVLGGALLSWKAPDNSGGALTAYKIFRDSSSMPLATVAGDKITYLDNSASNPSASYVYKVVAVNGAGSSLDSNIVTLSLGNDPPPESACVLPGVTVAKDIDNDQSPAVPATASLDIVNVKIAEPFTTADDKSITFTMKLSALTAAPLPNHIWKISWRSLDSTNSNTIFFVTFDTTINPSGAFDYGYTDETTAGASTDSGQCSLAGLLGTCPVTGSYDAANNQITFKLNTAAALTYGVATGSTRTAFTASFGAGKAMAAVSGHTQVLVGAGGTGLLQPIDDSGNGNYTIAGNAACNVAPNRNPLAVLTVSPSSGPAPLNVTLNGSTSSDPDAGDSIVSYSFNFGDGTPVTAPQASPTASHTYSAGTYSPSLVVTDSHGATGTMMTSLVVSPASGGGSAASLGFENFEAPGVLVQVSSSSQGPSARTVEYLGHDAGEPSIGVNWKSPLSNSGVTVYQSDLQTLFVTFNDVCGASAKASWVNRPAPTSQFVDSDPIGFTDRITGRTFAGQLTLASPTCKTSYTDDDGLTWIPTQGSGLAAGIDHQSIGGGPYHAPLTRPAGVPGLYPNAVYYCSQDGLVAAKGPAFCSRSDNGGLTFGPSVVVSSTTCGALHGHIKVAPDGTVYVPFGSCGGAAVSADNGITWTMTQAIPNLRQDPAAAVDNGNRLYFIAAQGTSNAVPFVATSNNNGTTWDNQQILGGGNLGINNIAFPAAVAADAGRAAVAFYGSKTAGNSSSNSFNGVWHLYVSETIDGGVNWTTVNATPDRPIQRGCILMGGGADICRNLLDFFDMTVDKEGRIQIGYVNGCAGGNCAQAGTSSVKGNAYTATAVIARQSNGPRLVAAGDKPVAGVGMPWLTYRRVGSVVQLLWSAADAANSTITGFQIWKGTASGNETLLTTVPGTATSYDDLTATGTGAYYYQVRTVTASNLISCGNNEVAALYTGDASTGLLVQQTPAGHPEQTLQGNAPASLAIDSVRVGETATDLVFTMKVSSLAGTLPANSRWRMVWNTYDAASGQFYAGMQTDANSTPTFEYGTIATGVVGLVVGVPLETRTAPAVGSYSANGTIVINVPKSAVGRPKAGDLLGAVNGRTFTGDNSQTATLERSTLLIDHTFVKAQRDNGYPAATYTVDMPPVISSFMTAPASGRTQMTMNFSASASDPDTGAGDQVKWHSINYGDGSAVVTLASSALPPHTYATSATYTATLTVTDKFGAQTSATVPVVPNRAPSAMVAASPSPASGAAPLTVTFTVSGTDPDGDPITFAINYGDGSSGMGNTHTYSTPGTYTATVTATDPFGAVSPTASVAVTVTTAPTCTGTCASMKLTPTQPQVNVGGTLTTRLVADLTGLVEPNRPGPAVLGGYAIDVTFDWTKLKLIGITGGTSIGFTGDPLNYTGKGGCPANCFDQANANGKLGITEFLNQSGNPDPIVPVGVVHVATLTFRALATVTTSPLITSGSLSTPSRPGRIVQGINAGGVIESVKVIPQAILNTISPAAICEGADFVLTVGGSNFIDGAVVTVNDASHIATFDLASKTLTTTVRATELVAGSPLSIGIINPGNTTATNTMSLAINPNPGPVVRVPDGITVMQTLGCPNDVPGANGETVLELASYLTTAGSATDNCGSVTRGIARVGGTGVSKSTFFPAGITTVTFPFVGYAGKEGTSTNTVTVLRLGDLNLDGKDVNAFNPRVDAVDLNLMANYLAHNVTAGTAPFNAPEKAADLNRDNKVDAVDLVILANYLAGNITCLPAN